MQEDIVLEGKRKIFGVDNTTKEEGNGYQDICLQWEQMSTYLCLKRAWNLHT
jgi:hypothetical protein